MYLPYADYTLFLFGLVETLGTFPGPGHDSLVLIPQRLAYLEKLHTIYRDTLTMIVMYNVPQQPIDMRARAALQEALQRLPQTQEGMFSALPLPTDGASDGCYPSPLPIERLFGQWPAKTILSIGSQPEECQAAMDAGVTFVWSDSFFTTTELAAQRLRISIEPTHDALDRFGRRVGKGYRRV